jgi:hypothetical protein
VRERKRTHPALNGVEPHKIHAKKSKYHESLCDGLMVFHNPQADHKLDLSAFRNRDVFQAYFSEIEGDWVYEGHDKRLMYRSLLTGMS